MKVRLFESDSFSVLPLAWEDESDFWRYDGFLELDLTDQETSWVKEGFRYYNQVQKFLKRKMEEG